MNSEQKTLQLIKGAYLIDCVSDHPIGQGAILIEGKRIARIGAVDNIALPAGSRIVEHDFPECSILPGLVDAHTHLNLPGDGRGILEALSDSDDVILMRSTRNAGIALRNGVTSLRDNGGRGRTVFSLRQAITDGIVPGPRLNICGWPITITMGHCYTMGGEADGIDEVTKAVRRLIGEGADYIKVMASGGSTPSSFVLLPSYTLPELRAIADETHRFGKLLAAHCTCTQAVINAVEAGADMLVHCQFREPDGSWRYQPEIVERIAQAEIWVNPTLHIARSQYWALCAKKDKEGTSSQLDSELDAAEKNWNIRCEMFHLMVNEGIKMVAGGDTGWSYVKFGDFVYEIGAMHESGLSAIRAIRSATADAAQSIGMGDKVGTLEIGKEADILIVEGNPLKDIMNLSKVKAVFKAGERVC